MLPGPGTDPPALPAGGAHTEPRLDAAHPLSPGGPRGPALRPPARGMHRGHGGPLVSAAPQRSGDDRVLEKA